MHTLRMSTRPGLDHEHRMPSVHDPESSGHGTHIDGSEPLTEERRLSSRARYPTTGEEWEKFRPDITRLYCTEKKKLADVKLIMEEAYGFKATDGMYKRRIKHWGLDKKLKKKDVLAIMALKSLKNTAERESVIRIRGHDISMKRVERYLKMKDVSSEEILALEASNMDISAIDVERHVQSLSPVPITSPDELLRQERFLFEAKAYARSSFALNISLLVRDHTPRPSLEDKPHPRLREGAGGVEQLLYTGIDYFQSGDVALAGFMWRSAFLKLEKLVQSPYIFEWSKLLATCAHLYQQKQTPLAMALIRHLGSLSGTRLSASCPHRAYANAFTRLQLEDVSKIWRPHGGLLSEWLKSIVPSDMPIHSVHRIEKVKNADTSRFSDVVQAKMEYLVGALSAPSSSLTDLIILKASGLRVFLTFRREDLAYCEHHAEQILNTVVTTPNLSHQRFWHVQALRILALCRLQVGKYQLAQQTFLDTLSLSMRVTDVEGNGLSWCELHEVYKELDWISNQSPIADGAQGWRVLKEKMEMQLRHELDPL